MMTLIISTVGMTRILEVSSHRYLETLLDQDTLSLAPLISHNIHTNIDQCIDY